MNGRGFFFFWRVRWRRRPDILGTFYERAPRHVSAKSFRSEPLPREHVQCARPQTNPPYLPTRVESLIFHEIRMILVCGTSQIFSRGRRDGPETPRAICRLEYWESSTSNNRKSNNVMVLDNSHKRTSYERVLRSISAFGSTINFA